MADNRLQNALSRRDKLQTLLQRLQGRLDAAQAAKKEVEDEIRSKKIEPENLENVISKLEGAKDNLLTQLETKLTDAETALKPYLEK